MTKDLEQAGQERKEKLELENSARALVYIIKTFFIAIILGIVAIGAVTFCLRAGWLIANNLFGG